MEFWLGHKEQFAVEFRVDWHQNQKNTKSDAKWSCKFEISDCFECKFEISDCFEALQSQVGKWKSLFVVAFGVVRVVNGYFLWHANLTTNIFRTMTDISISLPAKRRRGRPRKDANLPRDSTLHAHPTPNSGLSYNTQEAATPNPMIGSLIYGVIEGSFDAGYLISVKIGNGGAPFRGVVFQPRKFVPITPLNDVAPHAHMYQRQKISAGPLPDYNNNHPRFFPPSKQTVFRPNLQSFGNQPPFVSSNNNTMMSPRSGTNQQRPPVGFTNCMQGPMFDVLRPRAEEVKADLQLENMYYDGPNVTFHHDQSRPDYRRLGPEHHSTEFSEQVTKGPNLKLNLLSSPVEEKNYLIHNEMKSPNLGYHHALVSGNPLFLPPEFNGEPLDFMVGKNLTQMNTGAGQETSNEAASSHSGPYVLELATPQPIINMRPNSSVGCITDMDFVLSDSVQPSEHRHEHHGEFSENKQ
ncbi:HMG (high mobility group) box protein withARID/BRIGHT DNA-binding domain [Striga asiatica]|uniref:HMG (High mobility group) box protein withARID/BRIGHT DNA-binding domain n=1 Tax=Striga asiatica TaxID=4170 RepID=A0A5A7QHT5_STRAF|nr:HMG (high mobility group) box protein withARID/BRIGHT DNA-binding domain [Striga asiatica]